MVVIGIEAISKAVEFDEVPQGQDAEREEPRVREQILEGPNGQDWWSNFPSGDTERTTGGIGGEPDEDTALIDIWCCCV